MTNQAILDYRRIHPDPNNDDLYNAYVNKLLEILNADYKKWGMRQPWDAYENKHISRFPAGCVYWQGNPNPAWISYPRERENSVQATICYFFESIEKPIREERLRYFVRGIERALVADHRMGGFCLVSNVISVVPRGSMIAGNKMVIGATLEHTAQVRERVNLVL